MNVKYYIRGLGAGLIISAGTLMITGAVVGEGSSNSATQQTTTANAVIAYTTQAETTHTETETTTAIVSETTTPQSTTAEMTTVEATTAEATTAPSQEVTTASVNSAGEVQVTFHNVYYATQASSILYEAGVITDAQAFTDYLANNGYSSKIREGVYSITPGSSYDVIAKIITQG